MPPRKLQSSRDFLVMWYLNIGSMFICFVVKHALCDRQTHGQTDRQNYDCQDRASIAASCGTQKSVNTDSGTGISAAGPGTGGPWDW